MPRFSDFYPASARLPRLIQPILDRLAVLTLDHQAFRAEIDHVGPLL